MEKKLKVIENKIRKKLLKDIECRMWRSSIILEGEVDKWDEVVLAGKIAANKGFKGVVNKITVKGLEIKKNIKPKIIDDELNGKKVDVLIIGGGIIGCSIARELSKYNVSILLIEKEEDLAMHTSSRNDGMVHPGIEPRPFSKKAKLNVEGNKLYSQISKELDIPFKRCGSNILIENRFLKLLKPILIDRAKKNGVEGITILSKEKVKKIEPNILEDIAFAMHFSSTGIISPYKTTIAYGENAAENGVEFSFNTLAISMRKDNNKILSVKTNKGHVYPKLVINAAGVYSDEIAKMADDQFFTIHPRKGQIIILDKKKNTLINGVVAKPSFHGFKNNTKGGGVVKTIEGNILIGPDAYEQPFKEDYSTDIEHIDEILKKQLSIIPKLSKNDVINYFAGTRASTYEEDFIIEKSENICNLIHAAGIQSPGLASAPAISREIEKIAVDVLLKVTDVKRKENWNPYRKAIPDLSNMSFKERSSIIKKRPDYGVIICRCEEISKGEIIDSLNSPIPIYTVDGIKRRVRAGMGRCQGGFCMPLVMKIINEEKNINLKDITKKGLNSNIIKEEVQKCYREETITTNKEEGEQNDII